MKCELLGSAINYTVFNCLVKRVWFTVVHVDVRVHMPAYMYILYTHMTNRIRQPILVSTYICKYTYIYMYITIAICVVIRHSRHVYLIYSVSSL